MGRAKCKRPTDVLSAAGPKSVFVEGLTDGEGDDE